MTANLTYGIFCCSDSSECYAKLIENFETSELDKTMLITKSSLPSIPLNFYSKPKTKPIVQTLNTNFRRN